MRVLYGIQSTGNGHLTRSAKVINRLIKSRCMVDILTSGNNSQVKFPFPIKWNLRGLTFYYNGKGGINYWKTFKELKIREFLNDIKLDLSDYDLIISDYEPITAWAAKKQNKICVGLSNQCSFLSDKTPRPKNKNLFGELLLKKLVPVTHPIGLHFESYDDFIYTPIIRDNLMSIKANDYGHYTVYLPTFDIETIVKEVSQIRSVRFEIFTNIKKPIYFKKNVVRPIDKDRFEESLRNCHGIITAGGFQTSVEALYLGKKLMLVPTYGQYEQSCNSIALEQKGVMSGEISDIKTFVERSQTIKMDWKDSTDQIVNKILSI